MTRNFLVYTIIATYNGEYWIRKCLDSLKNSEQETQVLVIDNGSTDHTISIIETDYPEIMLIKTGKNLGFGQANNIGLKIALSKKADYAFLLNQDAWVEKTTISELIAAHLNDPALGIISPLHLNGSGEDFDPIFFQYFLQSEIHSLIKAKLLQESLPTDVVYTKFVNAAAWLISYDCLEKTGGFDPIFYHYGEDNNYAHRVLFNNFKFGIVCSAIAFHDKHYATSEVQDNSKPDFKHDRIILLHQACDIQNSSFKMFMVKRFLRYTALGIVGLISFNKDSISYNFNMVKTLLQSYNAISTSRRITANSPTPYLN